MNTENQPALYAELDSLHLCIDYLLGGYQLDLLGADMMVSKSAMSLLVIA